ncbi:MAG: MFS transporter [Coriobacteriia bacterium]|nr:MFS transporter [Coriobacteriia bacterium]
MRRIDLHRVLAARFLSRVGSEAAFFVGVWGKAAFELHATAGQLSVLMLALSLSSLIGSAVSGVLIDRYGPRVVLVAAEVLFAPAALIFIFADSMSTLTLTAALWALVGTPVGISGEAFAPYLTHDPNELRRINSTVNGATSVSFVMGPAIGALLVRHIALDWVFVFDAVTSVAAAVLVWQTRLARAPFGHDVAEGHPNAIRAFVKGMKVTYSARALRYYVFAGTLLWVSFGSFGVLEPLFFRDVVRGGADTLGWVNAIYGLGMLIGAAILPRLRDSAISAQGLVATVAASGFASILYVGFADLRIVLVGALTWGAITGLFAPLWRTLIHRDSPPTSVGRVMGTAEVHRRAGEMLPLAFAPALAGLIGVQQTMIAGALMASFVMLLSLGTARSIDREMSARPARKLDLAEMVGPDEPFSPLP